MKLKITFVGVTLTLALIFPSSLLFANSDSKGQKKFIAAGWERPDSGDYLKHQKEIEATPYDGIVLMINGVDDHAKPVSISYETFSARPWKKEWFAKNIRELQAVKNPRLTDNFIRTGSGPGGVDWFDDASWKEIVHHFEIAAWIAKEGNCRGILFDPEMYRDARTFTYGLQKGANEHSFQEYQEMARQRGREAMQAMAAIYPDMVVFTFWMNEIARAHAANIETSRYNLYPAFIDGWLDAAPASIKFVEGAESAYGFSKREQFLDTANWIRNDGARLVSVENRSKYRSQVQVSFGIYLDAYSYYQKGNRWYLEPTQGSRLDLLEQNLTNAAEIADEYVWTWGEHYRWWPTETKEVSPETWNEILPGTADIIRRAKNPRLLIADREKRFTAMIEADRLRSQLINGKFGTAGRNPESSTADWKTDNAPMGWSTWQKTEESLRPDGIFGVDPAAGRSGKKAVSLSGMFEGFYIQEADVTPGQRFLLRAWGKRIGSGIMRVDFRWKNETGWVAQEHARVLTDIATGREPGEWTSLSSLITVPENATKLVVLVGASAQKGDEGKVWFDEVSLYPLPKQSHGKVEDEN